MSSADVIDALFDRTVDVVQSLPKSGPIQTSYEEKLALYSLYKQATEGDVTSKRPGMLDMLGRAKWDAWSKREGMDSLDAKQLYVESMMRTLRKFEDRREARELIQELENFSGDVAERVMRGALATDDTASEASSAPAPLRHQRFPSDSAGDSETETDDEAAHAQEMADRLGSLRNPALGMSDRRRPVSARSVGGVSAQAQPPSVAGRDRPRVGPSRGSTGGSTPTSTTPQWDETTAARTEEESDDGTYSAGRSSHATSYLAREREEEEARARAMRASSSRPAAGNSRQISQQRQGQSAPTSTLGVGSRSGYHSQQQQQGIRPSASNPGFYSSTGPGGRVVPAPPRSDSNMGGGAGASLYSGIGPSSSRPPVEQHHYYHRASDAGAAASSAGAPSNRGGGGAGQAEVEQALQSIQASLAALHERLNRVEVRSGTTRSNASGVYGSAYSAVKNALHDLGVLFGLTSPSSSGADGVRGKAAVPSFGSSSHDRGKGPAGSIPRRSRLSSFLSLLASLLNLSLRLALDLTSLGILITLFLFLLRKVTGRGDPLLLLKMARTLLGRVRGGATGAGRVTGGRALVVGLGAAAGGAVRDAVTSVSSAAASAGEGGEDEVASGHGAGAMGRRNT
ncbi:ACBP-domain-containing protein [Microstroma glucosiphilum]|uniref:ACBP-domain-containing protein n=1 Tax=Pseudomicrostroma glucosiphilum TaxID=1684307 RepID=A0A316UFK7_9BASI|nr:ACBP-domain-containing protein [Pseudomicrostroma glucosiphilum]PWN24032.1 ACBP-domain-containing protein [Pseudomicrostroma glucosiphilum]